MNSIYEKKPWLTHYPEWAPHQFPITEDTALGDFRASAARGPEMPAISYFDHAISYREINRLSDNLASAFQDLDLGKGDRIIVDLQNVPQFPIATYAAWKVGAIVVPLNPMYKEKELAYFCRDSGAKLLLTLDEIASGLDLSFLADTPVEKIITTSSLDFLPPDMDRPELLTKVRKTSIPGTLDMLEMIETFKDKKPG